MSLKPTKIPKKVLMKCKEALVEKLKGEDVTEIIYGDEACKIGRILLKVIPVLCPVDALGIPIQREANSIILNYAHRRIEEFQNEDLPEIPGPAAAPRPHVNVHHATIAFSKLMQRIQNTPTNYPILDSLRSGSYSCTVNQQWSNAGVDAELFKP